MSNLHDGALHPALCYIAPEMPPGRVAAADVENLMGPAESAGFPAWYLDTIRSFLPPA